MEEVAVFRATKRRKLARPNRETPSEAAHPTTLKSSEIEPARLAGPDSEEQNVDDGDEDFEITNLIRARKTHRRPVVGVRFSNSKSVLEDEHRNVESAALVKADQPPDRPLDITGRFVSSTGQVVNVDQHM